MEYEHDNQPGASDADAPRTYTELWHGADVLIRKGLADQPGSQWVFLSVLLMLSLCLEAYLNFAGPLMFGSIWSEGERPLSRKSAKARLRVIAAACGVELCGGRKYWTVASNLLDLRESMTQARQPNLPTAQTRDEDGPPSLNSSWGRHCNG